MVEQSCTSMAAMPEIVYRQFICEERCEIVVQDDDIRLDDAIELHNQNNQQRLFGDKGSIELGCAIRSRTLPDNILTADGHDLEVMILSFIGA